jgi:AcrR family transcriptional regulator
MQNDLTQKGQQTRQHILATAVRLFMSQGYDTTTMRDIAAAAECSPGLTYRYFAQKEALVVALYEELADETLTFADSLAFTNMADRYHALMQYKMAQIKPHRAALTALVCALMQPNASLHVWGQKTPDSRDKMLDAFIRVVNGSTDKLNDPVASSMATLLYAFYILLVIFWSYDRTREHRATTMMLAFMREALKIVRPMMLMPVITKAVVKLAEILALVFVAPPEIPPSDGVTISHLTHSVNTPLWNDGLSHDGAGSSSDGDGLRPSRDGSHISPLPSSDEDGGLPKL